MPYYTMCSDKDVYTIYIEDTPYDLYMNRLPNRVYGKLLCTYNEETEQFVVTIDDLSSKAKRLAENGMLQLALEYELAPKSDSNIHHRYMVGVADIAASYVARNATHRKWCATQHCSIEKMDSYENALSYTNAGDNIQNIGQEFYYDKGEIWQPQSWITPYQYPNDYDGGIGLAANYSRQHIQALNYNIGRNLNYKFWYKIRFYLRDNQSSRFLKTITPVLTLVKT